MIKRVCLFILSLLLSFALLDCFVRIMARARGVHDPESILFRHDEEIGAWMHVPNSSAVTHWRGTSPHRVSFNAFGFRGLNPKTWEKPEGIVRILILGGSSTEAGLVEDGKTWPEVLQQELDRVVGTGRVEVINLGTSGYSSPISVKNFIKRGLPLRPDIVIVYHANNDFFGPFMQSYGDKIVQEEAYVDYEARQASWIEKTLCKSIILDRLNRFRYSRGGERNKAYLREYWADQDKISLNLNAVEACSLKALEGLSGLAESNDFHVVVGRQATLIKSEISQAELYAMWEILRMKYRGKRLEWSVFVDGLNRIKDAQHRFALAKGFGFINVEASVAKDLNHFIDHVHYTEEGEKAVASSFAQGLLEIPEIVAILKRN